MQIFFQSEFSNLYLFKFKQNTPLHYDDFLIRQHFTFYIHSRLIK